jgi:hypothetical protein
MYGAFDISELYKANKVPQTPALKPRLQAKETRETVPSGILDAN